MEHIIFFGISYTILFLLYILLFYIRGLKKKKIFDSMQFTYLKIKFELKNKDLNPKKIGSAICIIDPLIISLTGVIVTLPNWNYLIELFIGFIILIGLIYSFYEILGRIIKRKVKKK